MVTAPSSTSEETGIQTFRTHGRFVSRRFVPMQVEMIRTQQHFHDKVSIQEAVQDVVLKHLKRLVANDVRRKIVFIRLEKTFAAD